MKLKDFEKTINAMGLELISVTMSASHGSDVLHALAVKKIGKKRCEAYHWWCGCCRKSLRHLSYADVRANHAMYEAQAPCRWSMMPSLNFTELKKKM